MFLQLLRSISAPLASLIIMILGVGLFNTFISIRLELEGFSRETIGMVISALYVGILAGSFKLDQWIAKVGHAQAFVVFALTSTVIILLQAVWIDPWSWAALRFMGGVCMAGIFIVIESWFLIAVEAHWRGAVLSIYLGTFYGALSLGQLLINAASPLSVYPFLIAAGLAALSVLPMLKKGTNPPKIQASSPINLYNFFKISPLGFMGGVISGMLLAAIYGLLPIYAAENHLSVSEIGTLMSVLIFGGLSLQWPIGRFADRGSRRFVLNLASFATASIGLAIALQNPIHPWALLAQAWLFGGFSFTIYPLSMAYVCEKVPEDQIVSATGGFVLSYGLGAIAGPLAAPLFMNWLGTPGLFYFLSLITLGLGLFGLIQKEAPVPVVQESETRPEE